MSDEKKALFIPLKEENYRRFANGIKKYEYRIYGKRWNEKVCIIGRPVILSCGYGSGKRICGIITGFNKQENITDDFRLCYGLFATGPMAEIEIKLNQ